VGTAHALQPAQANLQRAPEGPQFSRHKQQDVYDDFVRMIDINNDGHITKLELIQAAQRDPAVAAKILPESLSHDPVEVSNDGLMISEAVFDAIDEMFDEVASGKRQIKCVEFANYVRKKEQQAPVKNIEMKAIFDLIDTDANGAISKLELMTAIRCCPEVAEFMLPGLDYGRVMEDESTFDAVNCVFSTVAGGKKRFSYGDFEFHFKRAEARDYELRKRNDALNRADRSQFRVLVISPGYGRALNPAQAGMLTNAGYQVRFIDDLPNPEQADFPVHPHLERIRAAIEEFKPHVMTAASKGGVYLVRLWQTGIWTGPSVLINAHPTCVQLPQNCPVVIAQGDQDEVYSVQRGTAEALTSTGSKNQTFLYWVGSSGLLPQGVRSREGDKHNMASLVQNDCLPRLIDAVLDPEGPEVHMVRSWRERLSDDRLQVESWLGYTPEQFQRRWQSQGKRGLEEKKLWDVPRNSDEFRCVEIMFRAQPKEQAAYNTGPQAGWARRPIVSIQRIENGLQVSGSAVPYYNSIRHDIEDQGLEFEPGVHTVWTFHGADSKGIDSIINDPMAGVRPIVAGCRGATLWGKGTYLARDAKYVGEAGFCGKPAADGTSRMLACLTMTGIPCAGDPQHQGLLPFRCRPHRYHSSVDHLSTPEVFVVQQTGAVLPAYVITFA
jgi:Ca2+-binding EF-hand superfamily protein